MSGQQKATSIFADALKSIIKSAFKLAFILFAWLAKAAGIVLSKTGETIERIIIKKSH